MIPVALKMINKARMKNINLVLPIDVICSNSINSQPINGYFSVEDIPKDAIALDIGIDTLKLFKSTLTSSKTILWNGPMGVFEKKEFSKGTEELGKILSKKVLEDAKVIVGGGDTVAAIRNYDNSLIEQFSHVSTGGGSCLEMLSGKTLPALEMLKK